MNTAFTLLADRLRTALGGTAEPDLSEIETVLDEVVALHDAACIAELLTLFDDVYPFPDVLFSLIHAMETIEDAPYAAAMIQSLPLLHDRAPEWSLTILIRVLNSPTTLAAFAVAARSLTSVQVAPLLRLVEHAMSEFPEAADACQVVLKSL